MPSSSSIYAFSKPIVTGGTVQQVLSEGGVGTEPDLPTAMQSAVIKARKGNTSPIYIGSGTTGGGTSGSGLSSTTGFELQPGEAISLDILGLGNAWVIGATTNDRYDILGV